MIFSIFYVISKNKTKIRIILFILYTNLYLYIIYFYINLIYNLYLIINTNIHYISIFFPPYRTGIVSSSKSLNKASLISLKSYPTNVIYIIYIIYTFSTVLVGKKCLSIE